MLLRRQPAGPPPRSRHIILFLTAIVLPSLLLVGLTLRMMAQQRELAGKREADERQRIAAATGATVLAVLDKATRAAVTGDPRPGLEMPAALIALIAPLRQGHIVLPWDLTPPSRSAVPDSTGPYAEWVRAGEHSEQRGRFDLAAGAYGGHSRPPGCQDRRRSAGSVLHGHSTSVATRLPQFRRSSAS